MVNREAFAAASARGEDRHAKGPTAISARYDRDLGRVVVSLSSGLDISFRPQDAQGLEGARPDDLAVIEVSPSGQGIHFPALDADLFVPALLEGFLGSQAWTASRMGALGGKSTSQAKADAARTNGRRGGRPLRKAAS